MIHLNNFDPNRHMLYIFNEQGRDLVRVKERTSWQARCLGPDQYDLIKIVSLIKKIFGSWLVRFLALDQYDFTKIIPLLNQQGTVEEKAHIHNQLQGRVLQKWGQGRPETQAFLVRIQSLILKKDDIPEHQELGAQRESGSEKPRREELPVKQREPEKNYPILKDLTVSQRIAGMDADGRSGFYTNRWNLLCGEGDYHEKGDGWAVSTLEEFFREGICNHYQFVILNNLNRATRYYQDVNDVDRLNGDDPNFETKFDRERFVRMAKTFGVNINDLEPRDVVIFMKQLMQRRSECLKSYWNPAQLPSDLIRLGAFFQRKKIQAEKAGYEGEQAIFFHTRAERSQMISFHWMEDCLDQLLRHSYSNSKDRFRYQLPQFFANPEYREILHEALSEQFKDGWRRS